MPSQAFRQRGGCARTCCLCARYPRAISEVTSIAAALKPMPLIGTTTCPNICAYAAFEAASCAFISSSRTTMVSSPSKRRATYLRLAISWTRNRLRR